MKFKDNQNQNNTPASLIARAQKYAKSKWLAVKKSSSHYQKPLAIESKIFSAYGATHVGLVRKNNEDGFLLRDLNDHSVLLAVADGVGGQNAGEIASSIACRTIEGYVEQGIFEGTANDLGSCSGILSAITHEAHRAIAIEATQKKEYRGMACTLTLVIANPGQVIYLQVGDSRLYSLHHSKLTQQTRDQTVSNALLDSGRISESEAQSHSRRNVLAQALGQESEDHPLTPQKGHFDFNSGDQLMICSDGLSDLVSSSAIEKTMNTLQTPEQVVEQLVQQALGEGGKDNTTIVNLRCL